MFVAGMLEDRGRVADAQPEVVLMQKAYKLIGNIIIYIYILSICGNRR